MRSLPRGAAVFWRAAAGALLPYRSEREGQQKMGYDTFAEPTANDPNLRIAVMQTESS
jgi:hypothetical protein